MPINFTNPSSPRLDLSNLRHFYLVATYGGFSKASRATGTSQPALSLGLKRLEAELGTELIVRSSRHFALTPAGLRLLSLCRGLEQDLSRITERDTPSRTAPRKRLRIGTAYSIGTSLLRPVCEAAGDPNELIELELFANNSFELTSDLAEGRLDAALLPSDVHDHRLSFSLLFKDQVTMVIGKGLQKSFLRRAWKEAVSELPLLTYARETPMRYLVDEILLRNQLRFRTSISIDGAEPLKLLVQSNLGAAFILRSLIREELEKGLVCEPPLPFNLPKRGVMIATRPDESGNELRDWLLSRMSQEFGA
ncbi:MAG: LysR family transcriptional regulator [Oligoflexia bacterium]|nr:LysR family transcriptional regulator [Oligoflexia bacterium]